MTDKQRADHVQAKYWNGFITRTECQKVFDDQAQMLMGVAAGIQKLDAAMAYICEKFGITPAEINAWLQKKAEDAKKSSLEKAVEEKKVVITEA